MHYFTSFTNVSNYRKALMKKNGFYVKYDLFIKDGFGAFLINLPSRIQNMEHFHIYDDFYKCNDYELFYFLEKNEGYEFTIGPGAPNQEGEIEGTGLYCTNYEKLINGKQKRK